MSNPTLPTARQRWPEIDKLAQELADEVCRKINAQAPTTRTKEPLQYKAQLTLELVAAILENRV